MISVDFRGIVGRLKHWNTDPNYFMNQLFCRNASNTLFQWSTLDILLTISNFATTCQLTLIRVSVDSFPTIDGNFCHFWDSDSPPLTEIFVIFETTLPHHWWKFLSFSRQRFPTIDGNFCHFRDSDSPPLTEIFVIFETTLPHHWRKFPAFREFYCYTVGGAITHHLKEYRISKQAIAYVIICICKNFEQDDEYVYILFNILIIFYHLVQPFSS